MTNEMVRKVGDRWPPLEVEAEGMPVDLRDVRVTYDFTPDSRRAKQRLGVPLRVLDPARGVVEAPRPRSTGICDVTIHYANGERETLHQQIRIVR